MGLDVMIAARSDATDEQIEAAKTFMVERFGEAAFNLKREGPWVEYSSMMRYYGAGYERGDWPTIYAMILAMRHLFGNAHYFDDSMTADDYFDDATTTDEELQDLWDHWLSENFDNYHKRAQAKFGGAR